MPFYFPSTGIEYRHPGELSVSMVFPHGVGIELKPNLWMILVFPIMGIEFEHFGEIYSICVFPLRGD